jgi:acyl carrier protein
MIETKNSEVLSRVQEIFQLAMGTGLKVDMDTEKEMVQEWDSLNHLNLVVELESAFDLGLTMEEIEGMHTVRGIVELIQSRQK